MAPLRRNTPNTAMVTTIRHIRQQLEKQGTKIRWRHVKGHSREKGGPTSHGNEAADALADKGKQCNDMEGVWIHVTSTPDYEGTVQRFNRCNVPVV